MMVMFGVGVCCVEIWRSKDCRVVNIKKYERKRVNFILSLLIV